MKPKIGIVLVNYNGEKFQNECIESIKSMDYKNYEIIVVDNASTDKSVEKLLESFSDIHLIRESVNKGIAEGNNIGIKKAIQLDCEYILLLNNDTEVDKYMLTNMLNKANERTLVTCKMFYFDEKNKIWFAGGEILWGKGTTKHYGIDEYDTDRFNKSKYVEYSPTCSLLIHRNVFEDIGFMDEKYFLYFDDTDFIARANNKGYKIWYEASAKLWHKVSSSSGGNNSKLYNYYINRNRIYFINKFCNKRILPKMYFWTSRKILILKHKLKKDGVDVIIKEAIKDYKMNNMYYKNLNKI
ncbi:glycosyltransferase family 2 protein [Clostridium thermobutyricum]|uniref:Putative glycosyltransferase EpsJ n=1 Tax=Clostridium thermobutyricum DSM 4928 TaxID=1121339 RepID=A0A1V4SZU4_9CLOT|nr:glycosyltransferase family 2 protein [Clostridium thermobutyricum]OPX50363.1 putative glycosyltransferase EpsJ [Clostridium thermobutyricum DSM 4928]